MPSEPEGGKRIKVRDRAVRPNSPQVEGSTSHVGSTTAQPEQVRVPIARERRHYREAAPFLVKVYNSEIGKTFTVHRSLLKFYLGKGYVQVPTTSPESTVHNAPAIRLRSSATNLAQTEPNPQSLPPTDVVEAKKVSEEGKTSDMIRDFISQFRKKETAETRLKEVLKDKYQEVSDYLSKLDDFFGEKAGSALQLFGLLADVEIRRYVFDELVHFSPNQPFIEENPGYNTEAFRVQITEKLNQKLPEILSRVTSKLVALLQAEVAAVPEKKGKAFVKGDVTLVNTYRELNRFVLLLHYHLEKMLLMPKSQPSDLELRHGHELPKELEPFVSDVGSTQMAVERKMKIGNYSRQDAFWITYYALNHFIDELGKGGGNVSNEQLNAVYTAGQAKLTQIRA